MICFQNIIAITNTFTDAKFPEFSINFHNRLAYIHHLKKVPSLVFFDILFQFRESFQCIWATGDANLEHAMLTKKVGKLAYESRKTLHVSHMAASLHAMKSVEMLEMSST